MDVRNYKTIIDHKEERYNWNVYIPHNATKLLLGTFPSAAGKRKYDFFYPNMNNRMWKILAKIADIPLNESLIMEEAVRERKIILDKLHLAMDDMAKSVYRMSNSSLDLNIFPVQYNNIFKTLDENPGITKIIITSSSSGSSVLSWFKHYCELNNYTLDIPKQRKVPRIPYTIKFQFNNRIMDIDILYSVSHTAKKSDDELLEMYTNAINHKS